MKIDISDYTLRYQERIKSRSIAQLKNQLMDLVSSKSWKLVTLYRQEIASITSGKDILTKLTNSFWIIYGAITHENNFMTHNLLSPLSSNEHQIKLFKQSFTRESDLAVILHLYYVDLWEEMAGYLNNIPKPFDLFVSIPEKKRQAIPTILAAYPEAHIYTCPNRGRDVAPFVEIYSAIAGLGYHFICKIHTKKSPHLTSGKDWRRGMLDGILGSEQQVNDIMELFDHYSEIGMVVPERYLYSAIDINTIANLPNLKCLSKLMGIPLNELEFEYPAGSMFWFRAESFKPLAESGIQTKDFPPEHGQLNNTLAHALERFFGLFIHHAHQYIIETSALRYLSPLDE